MRSFAINPLQWYATDRGELDLESGPSLEHVFSEVAKSGFQFVLAVPPQGMSVGTYRELLEAHGLAPAPGYFAAHLADEERLAEHVERAHRAGAAQAELGNTEVFVADELNSERRQAAATGVGYSAKRMQSVIASLQAIAEAITAEGVTPCMHPHVGSWIETESEAEEVLAGIDDSVLAFGPDTGHLAWAGADPAALIARHADRVGAMHLKEVRLDVATQSRTEHWDYARAARAGLWAEPGRGDVKLEAVMAAFEQARSRPFTGWYVVEVDQPSLPTPLESATASYGWVVAHSS